MSDEQFHEILWILAGHSPAYRGMTHLPASEKNNQATLQMLKNELERSNMPVPDYLTEALKEN